MGQNTQEDFIGPKQEHEDESLLEFLCNEPGEFFLGLVVLIIKNPVNLLVLAPFYVISIGVLEIIICSIEAAAYIQKFLSTNKCEQESGNDSGQASESDLKKFEELKKGVAEIATNLMGSVAIIQEQDGDFSSVEALGSNGNLEEVD